ncbi:M20/M25/M40 family metallo-hydrolase [Cellulophaga baltica]|uniref:M20/M25/M40 family metallo-hydrolase n=1 Tax=Cellulophaga TaxID=104264 RepID=UPI001C072398|nr:MULTISPECIES: M20/M25/M40 family metallo-hydrolase [Cellulophaga]MBU2994957.1 M20/M25/M40 family metallo-hydrolase [Cellulophaga baltica]MDO6766352.1 M20/M25/M40 family metallo-hydrolase [Cellulophaga sp. 1_MG-2023]
MKRIIVSLLSLASVYIHAQDKAQLESQIRQSIDEIRDFVAIPNNATDHADINRNLTWLSKKFKERGFNSSILPTEGESIFFATLPIVEEKPTILFYMHFDGQPVDASKWNQSNPYQVVLKSPDGSSYKNESFESLNENLNEDWRLFGRSTSDDKGPIVMFLNAFDLIKKNTKELPFNVKVILDSEEERGSKPLPKAVKEYKELLEADFLVINDGPIHSSGKPTIIYGCRGITTLALTTYGPAKPQHSGHYGNYAPNPALQLSQLLSSMKDTDGKVIIDGYYDGITLDDATIATLKNVPDDVDVIADNLQIHTPEKVGSFYQEALQYPSLNIRGLSSGWTGENARTIIPSSATADLDLRLVPETDGNKLKALVKKQIENKGFYITTKEPTKEERLLHDKIIKVTEGGVTDAFRTDLNNTYGDFILKTLKNRFEDDVVQIRIMGGTVPIAPFINELKIPAFIVPMVNPDNNQHSPNENLKISQIKYGLQTFYSLLTTPLK